MLDPTQYQSWKALGFDVKANGDKVKVSADNKQVDGDHYKKYGDLQPWTVITAWGLGYLDGTALKYIARWRDKGGINDIKKAIHFLEKFVEVEEAKGQNTTMYNLSERKINV